MPSLRSLRKILLLSILFASSISLAFLIKPTQAATTWSSPIIVDSNSSVNLLPSALSATNGTVWVAWQSNRYGQTTGHYAILYKTYNNGIWSTDLNLTTSGQNSGPYLVQLANGTVAIFWSLKTGGNSMIYYSHFTSSGWSAPTQITTTTLNDTSPSAALGRDGTLYLVWTRIDSTNPSVPAVKQLYYKTFKAGSWSTETQLTSDSNQNYGSNILVAKDGLVRVTWSKGAAGNNYQIFTKTYNGTVWSSETQLVSSSSTDEHPSMIQDRNGTLWIFWGRLVVVSALVQYYLIFGKYSYNLGQSWSSEIQLTPTPTSTIYDSFTPTAVQSYSGVKPLWVFYSSNFNIQGGYGIFAVTSTGINPVHDVAIRGFSTYNNLGTPWQYPGGLQSISQSPFETITVTVANTGDYVETISLTLTATNKTSTTIAVSNNLVGPGNTQTFYFYFNTTNITPARYGLSASIASLPGETVGNMGDNNASATNQIHIIPLGDIDQDGSVTLPDVSFVFYNYGFSSTCGCSRYSPYADIRGTGTIDIVDIGIVSKNFDIFT